MGKKIKINIKLTILILFFIVIGIVSSSIMLTQYISSQNLAKKVVNDSFLNVSYQTMLQLKEYNNKSRKIIELISLIDGSNELPVHNKKHKLLKLFTKIIEHTPFAYSFYLGHKSGEFYQIINLNIKEGIKEELKAPQNARWIIVKILKDGIKYEEFLDKNLNLISFRKTNSSYVPSSRAWYKNAIKINKISSTKPYKFSSLQEKGITFSKKINNNLVLGLDVTIESIQALLHKQKLVKGSEIFVFEDKGKIVAYSKIGSPTSKNIKNINDIYPDIFMNENYNKEPILIDIAGLEYYKYYPKVELKHGTKTYFAILSPKNKIMQPYNKQIFNSFITSILIFIFIAIPLIFQASKLIVKPLQAMEKEEKKIKNREFNEVKYIPTFISELDHLSLSLLSMSKTIQKYQKSEKDLMNSFIKLIAKTIDAKSKYTGGHCSRVPELSIMLVHAANKANHGEFKDFIIKNEEQLEELSTAAWLHDCGKVTTPEYVVDKATKLETIYNRIHEIRTRFEVIYRDKIIESLEKKLLGEDEASIKTWLNEEYLILISNFEFIANANIGGEFMSEQDKKRVEEISTQEWLRYFDNTLGISRDEKNRFVTYESVPAKEYLLADKLNHIVPRVDFDYEEYKRMKFNLEVPEHLYNYGEVYNLCIERGTLTKEEKFKINEHIIMSIIMLENLPLPDYLKNVPLYAGAHHETLIGTGYPRKLSKKDMPLASRMIALADVFEALTASDRPYKEAKKLSISIKILSKMVQNKHLDEDIFKLFLSSGIYLEYANKYLDKEQIDNVNINKYL